MKSKKDRTEKHMRVREKRNEKKRTIKTFSLTGIIMTRERINHDFTLQYGVVGSSSARRRNIRRGS